MLCREGKFSAAVFVSETAPLPSFMVQQKKVRFRDEGLYVSYRKVNSLMQVYSSFFSSLASSFFSSALSSSSVLLLFSKRASFSFWALRKASLNRLASVKGVSNLGSSSQHEDCVLAYSQSCRSGWQG